MNLNFLKGKSILITGGTGSFGNAFVKFLLRNSEAKKIIIFSRDELKQFHMQKEFYDKRLRFFIGDVRDLPRLQRAFAGVDIVVHAAALKQVPALEYNPMEAVKTNIIGSQNVIEAAMDQKVSEALLISTDKAAYPINLYGSTKLCAEKLFIAANIYSGGTTKFGAVRYGNVIGSRGSIVEMIMKNKSSKVQITDLEMTRFWINLEQTSLLVAFALEQMEGGELIIPKIPSMKLVDLFDAVAPGAEKEVIGIRPGEKLHEILLTEHEARRAIELDRYFIVLPEFSFGGLQFEKYRQIGKKPEPNYCFSSHTNTEWLTKDKLLEMMGQKITISNL